jgi:hypothetical protein
MGITFYHFNPILYFGSPILEAKSVYKLINIYFLFGLVFETESHSSGWPGICYVAQIDLILEIFLCPPPECYDDKCVPPRSALVSF